MDFGAGSRLLIRFPPEPHESLSGYVIRLTEANGLGSGERLYRLIQNNTPTYLHQEQLLPLAHLAGCSVGDLIEIHYRRSNGPLCKGNFDFLGHCLTKECFLTHYYPRVCPQCLATEGIASILWDLTFFTACPKHERALVDKCPKCGKAISWKRAKVSMCNCGMPLTSIDAPHTNTFSLQLARDIWQQFCMKQLPILHGGESKPSLGMLSNLSLNSQFNLILFVGYVLPNSNGLNRGYGRKKFNVNESDKILEVVRSFLEAGK